MKKMYEYLNLILVYSFSIGAVQSQGAIINEMSNGVSGAQEFVELLVVGSASNPTGNIDLSGWVLDDNNGDFESSGTGVGIADGHLRIAAGCLTSVPPGTLIVLYNAPDVSLTADLTDNDNDCVYFLPDNSACLEDCTTEPSTSDASYPIGCAYGPANWAVMTLRNGGDAVQFRDPSFNFFHGFSYGDVTVPAAPGFPTAMGGGTAFSIAGSGSGSEFIYNDGDFTDGSNFTRQTASNETPGLPNNANNRYVINQIRNGTFDYTNLNAAVNSGSAASLDNCVTLLSLKLVYFLIRREAGTINLTWQVDLKNEFDFSFDIEESADGIVFQSIKSINAQPMQTHYEAICSANTAASNYRLKIYLNNGEVIYSPIRAVSPSIKQTALQVYPNPANNVLFVATDATLEAFSELSIYNLLGQEVMRQTIDATADPITIDISELEQGGYLLLLKNKDQALIRTFVK